jgi:hypothetical protein
VPELAGPASFGVLELFVFLEDGQQFRRAVQGQLLAALALPKDQASAVTLRAPVGVADAVLGAGSFRACVAWTGASFPAVRRVAMSRTLLLAGLPVPRLAALVRVVAAVFPRPPLDLEPGLDLAGLQVDVRPAQPECLSLANAEGQGDRPAGTVASMSGDVEDLASLIAGEYVGFRLFGGWRLHEGGHVASDLPATHRDA